MVELKYIAPPDLFDEEDVLITRKCKITLSTGVTIEVGIGNNGEGMIGIRRAVTDNIAQVFELGLSNEARECLTKLLFQAAVKSLTPPELPAPYYVDDSVTLYNADCRLILPLLPKVDLVLTDPPYGMSYRSNYRNVKHKFIENDESPLFPIDEMWETMRDETAMFVFYSHKIPLVDGRIKNVIVWVKDNWSAGDLEGDFGNQYELIAFLPKGRFKIKGKRHSNVWTFPRELSNIHPTQKPVDLCARAIECSTNEPVQARPEWRQSSLEESQF